jgi:hypothetical protein
MALDEVEGQVAVQGGEYIEAEAHTNATQVEKVRWRPTGYRDLCTPSL